MKKNVKNKAYFVLLLLVVAVVLTSCGNSIVGTWTNSVMGYETVLQFNANGTFTMSALGILAASGNYTVSGNQITIRMSDSVYGSAMTAGTSTFSVSGNQLVIDGLVYTR